MAPLRLTGQLKRSMQQLLSWRGDRVRYSNYSAAKLLNVNITCCFKSVVIVIETVINL